MEKERDVRSLYRSPLAGRYASGEMLELFSDRTKILTWRTLWIALAEAQQELGLDISSEQIEAMRAARQEIDFELAESMEKETRHDVMAHIKTFGAACPVASGVIHLGATSCFVGDNTELILIKKGCEIIRKRLINLIDDLSRFAEKNRDVAALAFTHFQPAQLTTVGKRCTLWIQDLIMDLEDLEYFMHNLGFRGVKGTTGTQASFLKLFDGDHDKVEALDDLVTRSMGFHRSYPVTGQTYPRKVDAKLLSVLAGIAASASKFAVDIRLLAHEREMEEPFLETQVGSSAMAYKRNPMRCERISSLTRFVITLLANPYHTAANQWLERTLDDSAGKRIVISEAFLAMDAVLNLYRSVSQGLKVNPNVVKANLQEELGFMATENILMAAVKAGGNRQELHEKIRQHSMEASREMKETGEPCDLLGRLGADPAFSAVMKDVKGFVDPQAFIGRSAEQVDAFLNRIVKPILVNKADHLEEMKEEVKF